MTDKNRDKIKFEALPLHDPDNGRRLFSAEHAEIMSGAVTDIYFAKTEFLLRKAGLDRTKVVADIHCSSDGVLVGVEEVRRLLSGLDLELRAVEEGSRIARKETVMQISGAYVDFCIHETAILGILASSSGWATAATECVAAAGSVPVSCFASRHLHPSVAPVMERAAMIGGCVSASNILAAYLTDNEPKGTIPHSLILVVGDTLKASQLYLDNMPAGEDLVCLVDTFNDEAVESLRVAKELGDRLYAVRLDTPGERGGVTPGLVREVRARLDQAGAGSVKILVSGGVNPERIPELVGAGADAFGVGSYISDAAPIDMTMDIKSIEGRPVAKRGRIPGPSSNEHLKRIL